MLKTFVTYKCSLPGGCASQLCLRGLQFEFELMVSEGNPVQAKVLQQGGRTTLVLTQQLGSISNPKIKVVAISVASGDAASVNIVDPDVPVAEKAKAVNSSAMKQTSAVSKIPELEPAESESSEAAVTPEKFKVTMDAPAESKPSEAPVAPKMVKVTVAAKVQVTLESMHGMNITTNPMEVEGYGAKLAKEDSKHKD